MQRVPVTDFLAVQKGKPRSDHSEGIPILDVRSPSEYRAGHIPGAHSFPLFSDEERAIVGTAYKQEGKEAAVKKGLKVIGPKMVCLIEEAEKLESTQFRVYCWRGGMRSESLSWLLGQYGFQTQVLEGGYQAYRRQIQGFFKQKLPLKIVTGYTGAGKTVLLREMARQGAQVVDLEALANHQGSAFGYQKSESQPTTEHFQNLLFQAFQTLDLNREIWLEDESMRIGNVNLNEALFHQMSQAPHVYIDVPRKDRLIHLVEDYREVKPENLAKAIRVISKRLGKERTLAALAYIEEGGLNLAADQILPYYDKYYKRSMDKKKELIAERFTLRNRDYTALAKEVLGNIRGQGMP